MLGPCSGSVPLASVAQWGSTGSKHLTGILKDKDGKYEPSIWQQCWHLPPFVLPSPDQKDLGLRIAQCSQSRRRVSQVMAGTASYNKKYILVYKQRPEDRIQIPYQLVSTRPKLEGNLKTFTKLNRKVVVVVFII